MGSYFFGFNLTDEPFALKIRIPEAWRLICPLIGKIITDKVTQFGEHTFILHWFPRGYRWLRSGHLHPHTLIWTQDQRNEEARRLAISSPVIRVEDPLRVEIRYNTSENQ